jgi:transketolase C-terminal domain/subunit
MGNDDVTIFNGLAHLKIIDVCCPNQLLGILKWIVEGSKGLIYLRVMRAPSKVVYDSKFKFQYGKAYVLKEHEDDQAVVVSSGRGIHEAVSAAEELENQGISISVVDMPSIDKDFFLKNADLNKPVIIAEQNNGFIWEAMMKKIFHTEKNISAGKFIPINTLDQLGNPQFIHSGTYSQLVETYGLSSQKLVETIKKIL